MNLSISTDTWVCLSIIVVAFIVCLILVLKFKNSEKMEANRRIIEYFPTLVSTLGVLGTFWGITKGLMAFDTSDLDQSIPGLLDGLKTAFFTSLAGMIGSMFLSAFISKKQDERDGGISDINQAAGEITKSVKAMSDANTETMRSIQQQLTEQEADRKAFYRTVGEVMSKISDTQKSITSAIRWWCYNVAKKIPLPTLKKLLRNNPWLSILWLSIRKRLANTRIISAKSLMLFLA